MTENNSQINNNLKESYKVWFFAGGESRDDKFNVFTGSFIRLMMKIMGNNFEVIKGIYFRSPMMNVIWALNNSQRPIADPGNNALTTTAFRQIISAGLAPDTRLILTSSSSGSVVAAQTACYLAEKNRNNVYFSKPFHLVLGASMLSPRSELFIKLKRYQKEGTIGTIIYDDVQDEGDTSAGIGGISRSEAFSNAFGLMVPWLSRKFRGPSFLNTHPLKGHIHRKRSKTIKKALDYIDIILIRFKLCGEFYKQKAITVINVESSIHNK
jgi:hypothetical protein